MWRKSSTKRDGETQPLAPNSSHSYTNDIELGSPAPPPPPPAAPRRRASAPALCCSPSASASTLPDPAAAAPVAAYEDVEAGEDPKTLMVVVLQAKGLLPMDPSYVYGKPVADPFLSMRVGNETVNAMVKSSSFSIISKH